MHKHFVLNYIFFIKNIIKIRSKTKDEDIIIFINNTILNLPKIFRYTVNIIGFLNLIFYKMSFLKIGVFVNIFSKIIIFDKYILFIKTLIIVALFDDYEGLKNPNEDF